LFYRKKHAGILEKFIELGANCTTKGWLKVSGEWIFCTPLELAFHFRRENESAAWTDSIRNMINVLHKEKEKTYFKMTQLGNFLNK